jgi:hypothetical protein
MAPEQAVADPHVDQRADIYALGVVAYELLAGRTPFTSGSPQQMLAAQVTEKPDPPSRHRPGIAPALEQALMRCLEKRAADRFQTADELLAVLEPLATPSGGMAPTSAQLAPAPAAPASRRPVWIAGGAALLVMAAMATWGLTRDRPATLALGRSTPVTSEPGLEIHPDISPDGKMVAFAAGNFARMRIYLRPVAGGRTLPLSDDSTALETSPKWSHDGSQILFLVRGGVSIALPWAVRRVRSLLRHRDHPIGGMVTGWVTDRLRARGFTLRDERQRWVADVPVTAPDIHSCSWSPTGEWIACVSMNSTAELLGPNFGNLAPSAIVLFPSRGGAARVIATPTAANGSPTWSVDGRHLYFISNRDGPRDVYASPLRHRRGARQCGA